MAGDPSGDARARLAHDARQPLNAIRLIAANLQVRLGQSLDAEDAAWLAAKLEKIDRQVDRLAQLLESPE
ncbi:MAG: hypothetical protein KGL54_12780 [Sphingomonadales bacterium]|nr:hypothetical protein [Sphingomonadales bacterium]